MSKTNTKRRKRAIVSSSSSSSNAASSSDENQINSPALDDEEKVDSESMKDQSDESIPSSSDSSEKSLDGKFPDGYDKDCIGDEEDRNTLNAMPEVERESELYRRMEVREELLTKRKIEQKLRQQQKAQRRKEREKQISARNKRQKVDSSASSTKSDQELSSDSSDSDKKPTETPFSSSDESIVVSKKTKKVVTSSSDPTTSDEDDKDYRNGPMTIEQKKKKARSDQLKKLKKARKLKEKKNNEKKKLKVSDVYSSDTSDDSDTRIKRNRQSSTSDDGMLTDSSDNGDDPHDRPVQSANELNVAKLSRFRCEQWCHHPWFRQLVPGCFVRVGLGMATSTGKETYRCAEIVSVLTTLKDYDLGPTRTNLAFNVRIGKRTKGYRLNYMSNQLITESEFTYYKNQAMKENIDLPNYKKLKLKAKSIEDHKSKELGAVEFKEMISTKKKFQHRPTSFAREKTELIKAKHQAEIDQDTTKASVIASRLSVIEAAAHNIDTERMTDIRTVDKINISVREAHIHREKAVDLANREYREAVKCNPFSRRKTTPMMGTAKKVIDQLDQRYLTEIDTSYEEKTFVNDNTKKKLLLAKKKQFDLDRTEDSLETAHDFDLNLDICDALDVKVAKPSTIYNPKKILSTMAEYKRKKGLI